MLRAGVGVGGCVGGGLLALRSVEVEVEVVCVYND